MIEQNSPEWFEARCGKLSASRVYDATARQKSGKYYAARADYLIELATERLTGVCTQHYVSAAMQWGIDREPDARAAFEYVRGVEVGAVGWLLHEQYPNAGATPDGIYGAPPDYRLVEFKCPTTPTHVETLLTGEIDPRYRAQMLWQLACCPLAVGADFVSYDPRLPPELRLFVAPVERDESAIALLEHEVGLFLVELDGMLATLRQRAA